MKKKQIASIFGSLVVAGTVATVASCGTGGLSDTAEDVTTDATTEDTSSAINANQEAINRITQVSINGISKKMVLDALGLSPNGDPSKLASSVNQPANLSNIQLNDVPGLELVITNWIVDDIHGNISLHAEAKKPSFNSKQMYIKIPGWDLKEHHNKINELKTIDAKAIKAAKLGINVNPSLLPSEFIKSYNPLKSITIVKNNDVFNIKLSALTPNDANGSISFSATVSSSGIDDKVISDISISGFNKKDQKLLNDISLHDVLGKLNIVPEKDKLPNEFTLPTPMKTTLNGLNGVTITVSDLKPVPVNGSLTSTITVSKNGLISKTFTDASLGTWETQAHHDTKILEMVKNDDAGILKLFNISNSGHENTLPTTDSLGITPNEFKTLSKEGLDFKVTIDSINPNQDQGTLTFDVTVSKDGLTSVTRTVDTGKWLTTYEKLHADALQAIKNLTSEIVKQKLSLPIVDQKNTLPTATSLPGIDTGTTKTVDFVGLLGATITVDAINPDATNGTLTLDVTVSKDALPPFKTQISTGSWLKTSEKLRADTQLAINNLTSEIVKQKLNLPTVDHSNTLPTATSLPGITTGPLDHAVDFTGLSGTTVTVDAIHPNADAGTLTLDVTVSKDTDRKVFTGISTGTWETQAHHDTQDKINAVTADQVKSLIVATNKGQTLPSDFLIANPIGTLTISIDGHNYTINNNLITPNNDAGTITFTPAIVGGQGYTDKVFSPITISGFLTNNQNKINILSNDDILSALNLNRDYSNTLPTATSLPGITTSTTKTVDFRLLSAATVTIDAIHPDATNGALTVDVTVSKDGARKQFTGIPTGIWETQDHHNTQAAIDSFSVEKIKSLSIFANRDRFYAGEFLTANPIFTLTISIDGHNYTINNNLISHDDNARTITFTPTIVGGQGFTDKTLPSITISGFRDPRIATMLSNVNSGDIINALHLSPDDIQSLDYSIPGLVFIDKVPNKNLIPIAHPRGYSEGQTIVYHEDILRGRIPNIAGVSHDVSIRIDAIHPDQNRGTLTLDVTVSKGLSTRKISNVTVTWKALTAMQKLLLYNGLFLDDKGRYLTDVQPNGQVNEHSFIREHMTGIHHPSMANKNTFKNIGGNDNGWNLELQDLNGIAFDGNNITPVPLKDGRYSLEFKDGRYSEEFGHNPNRGVIYVDITPISTDPAVSNDVVRVLLSLT
ncbi:MAG: lipoprotein 17-related variable surface protein [Mycoplasma sp.]|nr:lipoprotein 17-related variable surface protein [Mycoplasma sp.]